MHQQFTEGVLQAHIKELQRQLAEARAESKGLMEERSRLVRHHQAHTLDLSERVQEETRNEWWLYAKTPHGLKLEPATVELCKFKKEDRGDWEIEYRITDQIELAAFVLAFTNANEGKYTEDSLHGKTLYYRFGRVPGFHKIYYGRLPHEK